MYDFVRFLSTQSSAKSILVTEEKAASKIKFLLLELKFKERQADNNKKNNCIFCQGVIGADVR